MMTRWISMGLLCFLAVAASNCGGGSSPTQPTPQAQQPPPPPVQVQPTLSSIQVNVFSARCTQCHSGATPEGGLRLSPADAYTNLINVPSTQRALMRVVPNDSANSYLIHKLEGRADIAGHQMPPAPLLTIDVIQAIRQWIDRGAPNN